MPRSGNEPGRAIGPSDNGECRRQRFFGQKAQALDRQVRRQMIEPNLPSLSVGKQCALLSISRSSFY